MSKPVNTILYIMHVSWGWIKQRPHFIAEELSKNYYLNVFTEKENEVNVVNKLSLDKLKIRTNIELNILNLKKLSYYINFIIKKIRYNFNYNKSSIIWISHPSQFNYFNKKRFNNKKLIYDCMDDHVEMYQDSRTQEKLISVEYDLCLKSNTIICSSSYLKEKLQKRHSYSLNIIVINNAIAKEILLKEKEVLPKSIREHFSLQKKNVVFIGTISRWFDFDVILKNLKQQKDVNYILVGPKDTDIPQHESIITILPVEHKYVFEIMNLADCLIMPFRVNELIKSVNPVKAYEYIYSLKPVIIVRYGESEKFSDYVNLYKSQVEFDILIDKLVKGELKQNKNKFEIDNFIKNNTWNSRVKKILEILK